MKIILASLLIVLSAIGKIYGQTLDSLKLTDKEILNGYTIVNENNCISIQARMFYKDPTLYEMLIGKLKSKQIQSFDNSNDKGCIIYFEFEDNFKGEGFVQGLLWGGNSPTTQHPEEILVKGKFLVIWSFQKGSPLAKVSKEKITALLK